MIKKYYSKYTGQQIDEAVAALIENNVRVEDLSQEVVDLITSKANEQDLAALQKEIEDNQIKVVEIPVGILQKAVNEENLTAEELTFFTSDYRIYKCAVPLEEAEELGLQMYFVTSVTTDNTVVLSSHLYNVIIDFTTGKVELEASVDLEVIDLKDRISNLEGRINNTETEVSNLFDVVNDVSENFSNKADTAYVDSEIARVEGLIGGGEEVTGTAVPNEGHVEKIYFNVNLTPEEVDSIITNANLEWINEEGTEVYPAYGSDAYEQLMIIKLPVEADAPKYMMMGAKGSAFNDSFMPYLSSGLQELLGQDFEGWVFEEGIGIPQNGEITLVGNLFATEPSVGTIGAQNEALKQLISITPFDAKPIDMLTDRVDALEESVNDVYTKTEVNNIIGDINSLLDQINGEVI